MDLTALHGDPVETADASAYIVSRLGFRPSLDVPLLDAVSLEDAIRGMGIFGRNILGDDADHHDVMEAGYAAIAGGDGAIGKVLDAVCAIHPQRAGAITAYGGLHAFARDIPDSTTRERLLAIMASHASTRRSTTTGSRWGREGTRA